MAQNFRQLGKTISSFLASAVVCPAARSGKPAAGDVVVAGALVGISETTTSATTDPVIIQTVGVYAIPVVGANGAGNVAVAAGDALYVAPTTAIVSKVATGIYFGIALGAVTSGATGTIDVRLASSF